MPPRPPTPAIADDLVERCSPATRPCLAASQIGETKRIVAYLNEGAGRPQVMYNPRVTQKRNPTRCRRHASRAMGDGRHALRLGAREQVLVDGELVGARRRSEGQRRPGRTAHDRPLRGASFVGNCKAPAYAHLALPLGRAAQAPSGGTIGTLAGAIRRERP